VNESVQLVRQHKLASAARLVNAILRQACRTRHIDICEQIEDDREQLAARFSHPRWLVEKWLMEWGREETTELLQADNSTPVTTIRLNPLTGDPEQSLSQLEHEGLSLSPSEFVEGAYRVTNGPMTESSTLVREGKIYIQDEASQLITSILDPRPGLRVLDVCAAPGSKATQMAAAMLNQGFIMAGDIHEHRLRNLQQISQRLGAAIIHPVVMDGRQPLPIIPHRQFDRVFVDAPCSGTGTLRRHPEIKWRLQPEDLTALAELQITLLASAAMMLAPGGRLVYSTCSLEPQENEHVVEQFLKNHPHFRLIPSGAHPALLTDKGYVRTFPHRHHMDGFFAAVVTTHA
jgi:16S rRNA (cytosine967-C5)-methyltransferase